VGHDREDWSFGPEGAEEGDLVDVVENDVRRIGASDAPIEEGNHEIEIQLVSRADDAISVGLLVRRAAPKAGREQRATMAPASELAEDLFHVNLRAAGAWVREIPPIEGDDVHGAALLAGRNFLGKFGFLA